MDRGSRAAPHGNDASLTKLGRGLSRPASEINDASSARSGPVAGRTTMRREIVRPRGGFDFRGRRRDQASRRRIRKPDTRFGAERVRTRRRVCVSAAPGAALAGDRRDPRGEQRAGEPRHGSPHHLLSLLPFGVDATRCMRGELLEVRRVGQADLPAFFERGVGVSPSRTARRIAQNAPTRIAAVQ